jgi:uncharacterized protein YbbK (DUF523 family)
VIRLGVSQCLLGDKVRYDGGHERDQYITEVLSSQFELIAICPEVAIGLGVPRQPIRLIGDLGRVQVVAENNPNLDVTEALEQYGEKIAQELTNISGYILKRGSPSCGLQQVKRYPCLASKPLRGGIGKFTESLQSHRPKLPLIDEQQLQDQVLREEFFDRIVAYQRSQTSI